MKQIEVCSYSYIASALVNGAYDELDDPVDQNSWHKFYQHIEGEFQGHFVIDIKRDEHGEPMESFFGVPDHGGLQGDCIVYVLTSWEDEE